jgi:hypothetical protein
MHRIRVAMAEDAEQNSLLHGIVEADETYIGGKPRKANKRDDDKPNKRGRGTKKAAVIGIMERGGRVVARPAKKASCRPKVLRDLLNVSSILKPRYWLRISTADIAGWGIT